MHNSGMVHQHEPAASRQNIVYTQNQVCLAQTCKHPTAACEETAETAGPHLLLRRHHPPLHPRLRPHTSSVQSCRLNTSRAMEKPRQKLPLKIAGKRFWALWGWGHTLVALALLLMVLLPPVLQQAPQCMAAPFPGPVWPARPHATRASGSAFAPVDCQPVTQYAVCGCLQCSG